MSDICSSSVYTMSVEEDAAALIAIQQHEIKQLKIKEAAAEAAAYVKDEEIEQLKKKLRKTKRALDQSLNEYTDLEYVLDKKIKEINHMKENGNPDRARHQGDNFRLRARMRECPVCSQLPKI